MARIATLLKGKKMTHYEGNKFFIETDFHDSDCHIASIYAWDSDKPGNRSIIASCLVLEFEQDGDVYYEMSCRWESQEFQTTDKQTALGEALLLVNRLATKSTA